MKKMLILSLALAAFSASAHRESANYRYAGDVQFASFCRAAVTDDVGLLKKSIRNKVGEIALNSKDVLRKLISPEGLKCNDTDLVEFSKQHEAKEVHAYLTQDQ